MARDRTLSRAGGFIDIVGWSHQFLVNQPLQVLWLIYSRYQRSNKPYLLLAFAALDSTVNPGISDNSAALKLYCSQTKLKRLPVLLTALTE